MTKLKDVAKDAAHNRPEKLKETGKEKKTICAGGTPEFDEATGKYLSPAERMLRKNFKWAK